MEKTNQVYIMGIEFERFMELLYVWFYLQPLADRHRILGEAWTELFQQQMMEGGKQ